MDGSRRCPRANGQYSTVNSKNRYRGVNMTKVGHFRRRYDERLSFCYRPKQVYVFMTSWSRTGRETNENETGQSGVATGSKTDT